jgi:hypothetical protein
MFVFIDLLRPTLVLGLMFVFIKLTIWTNNNVDI